MQEKVIQFKTLGMNKDLSESSFDPKLAFDNLNIRYVTHDDNTMLSIVNERGPKNLNIHFKGIPIGLAVIDNKLVLFTTNSIGIDNTDCIYLVSIDENEINSELMYLGDLGFNVKYPIETLPIYENYNAIKVYWTDGLNLPRVINIARYYKDADVFNRGDKYQFDFALTIDSNGICNVTKVIDPLGVFSSGTVQYVFTYYNQFGSESNIFCTTPLYYTAPYNRGGSPEEIIRNSFHLRLQHLDPKFDFVRVYSIHRTSIDAVPTVKRVADIPILNSSVEFNTQRFDLIELGTLWSNTMVTTDYTNQPLGSINYTKTGNSYRWELGETQSLKIGDVIYYASEDGRKLPVNWSITANEGITGYYDNVIIRTSHNMIYTRTYSSTNLKTAYFVDDGRKGDSIDPTILLYLGGKEIVALTLAQKDNTLFLGNILLKNALFDSELQKDLKKLFGTNLLFVANKELKLTYSKGLYPYENLLKYNHSQITTFMNDEYYRFGVLVQSRTGEWSLPIWIGDKKNDVLTQTVITNSSIIDKLITAEMVITGEAVERLKQYSRIRPVIVYPSLSDRHVICQGVLNPTVFNAEDRKTNSPYALASWFFRPYCPDNLLNKLLSEYPQTTGHQITEFRHYYSLPKNTSRACEILCNDKETTVYKIAQSADKCTDDLYFIDQNIVTFHSPDIEFNTDLWSLSADNIKLEIKGKVYITGTSSDLDILTSTPPMNFRSKENSTVTAEGFHKLDVSIVNNNSYGSRGLVTINAWWDEIYGSKDTDENYNSISTTYGFPVYPWHRKGSLNNLSYDSTDKDGNSLGTRSSKLDTKKMSNLRFSNDYQWLKLGKSYSIAGLSVFHSDQQTNTRMEVRKTVGGTLVTDYSYNYYGNVNKIVSKLEYPYADVHDLEEAIPGYKLAIAKLMHKSDRYTSELLALSDLRDTGFDWEISTGTINNLINGLINKIQLNKVVALKDTLGSDPISIKYKSTPHVVIQLPNNTILPTAKGLVEEQFNANKVPNANIITFWNKPESDNRMEVNINQEILGTDYIDDDSIKPYGWLWLANLVRVNDSPDTRFGGTDDEAIQNNLWIPCGEPVTIEKDDTTIKLIWSDGDTYFLRYDCLKTFPFTLLDTNSIVDILSFKCHTRINMDGRYDLNRALKNNLTMMPTNFNHINEVYSLQNNFFGYRMLDQNIYNLKDYPLSITWTLTKTNGESVDNWTNVTMSSTLNLDGKYGEITSLKNFNNQLIAFLEHAINLILYNEQMQFTTAEGVPIEIANSNKVTGTRAITTNIGCMNKWSICDTPEAIYFIDDYNKDMFMCNDKGVVSLSSSLGLQSWIFNHSHLDTWNPYDFSNVVAYYDSISKDVLFISGEYCLAYSELLDHFTSFYSYEGIPYFFNIHGKGYWIKNEDIVEIETNSDWSLDKWTKFVESLLEKRRFQLFKKSTVSAADREDVSCVEINLNKFNNLGNLGIIRPTTFSLNSAVTSNIGLTSSQLCLSFSQAISQTATQITSLILFSLPTCSLWQHNTGKYNDFFGEFRPYSTTVLVNPEPTVDKVFSTLEFRADTFNSDDVYIPNLTFDTIEAWNEYLHGINHYGKNNPSSADLKKKFRIWRADIPRNNQSSTNKRDRLRNPWIYLKLSTEIENYDKIVLHDMIVHYYC